MDECEWRSYTSRDKTPQSASPSWNPQFPGTVATLILPLEQMPSGRRAYMRGSNAIAHPRIYWVSAMDSRPVVWEAANLRHLLVDHPQRNLSREEIEQALNDRDRIESTETRSAVSYHTVVGATLNGRLLVVVWVEHPAGRFPVHARQAGRRAARRYYR